MPTATTHTSRRKPSAEAPAEVVITLSRAEATALARAAETGLRVSETLGLIQKTATTDHAIRKVQVALSRQ